MQSQEPSHGRLHYHVMVRASYGCKKKYKEPEACMLAVCNNIWFLSRDLNMMGPKLSIEIINSS